MISDDAGVSWHVGAGGVPWRLSVDGYRPVLLDLLAELPAQHRLVGAASAEAFLRVAS